MMVLRQIVHGVHGQAFHVVPPPGPLNWDKVLSVWYLHLPPDPPALLWMTKAFGDDWATHRLVIAGLDPAVKSSATDEGSWSLSTPPYLSQSLRMPGDIEASDLAARAVRCLVNGDLTVAASDPRWDEWFDSYSVLADDRRELAERFAHQQETRAGAIDEIANH